MQKLREQANGLSKTYPQMSKQIGDKLKEAEDNWKQLEDLAKERLEEIIIRNCIL